MLQEQFNLQTIMTMLYTTGLLQILKEKNVEWERLAQGLLEYETLTGDEIKRVMNGEPPHKDDDEEGGEEAGTPSVTAIPKAKPKKSEGGEHGNGDMEPEPSA